MAITAILLLGWVASVLGADEKASKITTSNVIASAGTADLFNGMGDILAKGACQGDVKAFCKDLKAGEGRLAYCLTKRMRATRMGNAVGKKVSDKCQDALTKFKLDRSTNINKDVPLARACQEDAPKLCKGISDEDSPGSVLACLREKKDKLKGPCKMEVFRTQEEASEDFRTDYKLNAACKDDVSNLCSDVEPGQSRELACLVSKRIQVSWECQNLMFLHDKETVDDIRLSTTLFASCYGDFQKYCKDVEPGNMRVQECLEDNIEEDDFSEDCKDELEATIAKRVSNFRLDKALRKACEDDFYDLCGAKLEVMDDDDKIKETALNCLQQYRDDIKSEECKSEMFRRTKRASKDIRFDEVLADACVDDREKYCSDVSAGSARVIRCLADHRSSLGSKCAAALFDHEVKMAEDIDFKYPMKKACSWEIKFFCKDVPHGHARVVRCLEDNLEEDDMSKQCKDEVAKDMNRMATDYRLNFRLNSACNKDIQMLCPNQCQSKGEPCGGLVLHCLQDKSDNISSQACQDEIFYYELMEVSDFRNDVILAEACRDDVEAFCKDVEPGEGRVHACLRQNRETVSDKCNREENKLQALEYKDIRLRPKLNKLCSEEKAVYCKEVKPGKARVIKCLMENMAQPNFGEECKEELELREDGMKSDYRYDIGVFTNCEADVESYCKEEKSKLRGSAAVLKCLVGNFKELVEQCQVEMSRAVRLALWDYKPGAALTASCDADVDSSCPKGARSKSGTNVFTIGVVGRCLSKALVSGKRLDNNCRSMVLAAAPKDARSYFDQPESTSAIVQKIADLQSAVGLEGTLVDPYARGGSTVTVTGWVALTCIISLIIVILGGAVMVYRQATGVDKPHTVHVKMGDA